MKRVFYLILREVNFLKKTIIVIGIILIAFVAALLSVVSVLLDVPNGMYEGLNEYANVYTLTVNNVAEDFAVAGGFAFQGNLDGITRYATLTGKNSYNTNAHTSDPAEDEKLEQTVAISVTGSAVVGARAEQSFAPYVSNSTNYVFPSKAGELSINKDIAKLVGVSVGDTVTISPDMFFDDPENGRDLSRVQPETYTVVGYVDTTGISNYNGAHAADAYLSSAQFYLIPNGQNRVYSSLKYCFSDAKTLHSAFLSLTREGYTAAMQSVVAAQMENIAIAQAFFFAVTFVLGAMVLFILYSLIAIFYRQRRGQICRLKLLGASSGTVAAVYCFIAVFLVTVAVVLGALFSMAFNVYFINLCGRLFRKFSANFVSRFRPIVPLIVYGVLAVFTVLLFFRVNHKIRNAAIAREVRHE